MRVTILHNAVAENAPANERDVLDQAAAVRDGLRPLGHDVSVLPVDLDLGRLRDQLTRERPERLFNLVESLAGDDRGIVQVPALLEGIGIPFTGAPLQAVLMTTNKLIAKRLLRDAGLPTAQWYAHGDPATGAAALAGTRVIVKPVWDHGSGALDESDVQTFPDGDSLMRFVAESSAAGRRFAERYVDGREFNLALLAGCDGAVEVLPPAEMIFRGWTGDRPRVVGYRAKWVEDSFEYRNTCRRFEFGEDDAELLDELARLAREVWHCFDLRGYARVDFRVDADGSPMILEANVNPCLSPDAGFAAALDRAGIDFSTAVDRILADTEGS